MGALISLLRERIEDNAMHAVQVYTREVAEYRTVTARADDQTGMLDFAVFLRRRTLDLAAADRPLTENDLATMAAVGRARAELGLSVGSQLQVLRLHAGLMLQEIHEASGPADVDELLRTVGWLGAQGVRARVAFLQGYTDGAGRVELFTRALLADQQFLASRNYTVSVLRFPAPSPSAAARSEVEQALAPRRLPTVWFAADEFVVLTTRGTLQHVRDAVAAIGRPCQVGSAESLASAREVSRVAPVEDRPTRLYTVADVFVEMSVAQAPQIDAWLRSFTERLGDGPSLIPTLSAYYRNDMARTATAAALNIHPRTLDYRLQRARVLTGIDPGSTSGVRILGTAVTRIQSGGWL